MLKPSAFTPPASPGRFREVRRGGGVSFLPLALRGRHQRVRRRAATIAGYLAAVRKGEEARIIEISARFLRDFCMSHSPTLTNQLL